jgi:hypothetical protein
MNDVYCSAIAALAALTLVAACNEDPPAKSATSPDLIGPAARAPSVNGPDVKGPQANGPSLNLYADSKDKTDGGSAKP